MKISEWLVACRPKTLGASVAPVMIGTAMAYADGKFHFISATVALLAALFIQIGTNFFNDCYDVIKGTDRSDRKGPLRPIHLGASTPEQSKRAAYTAFFLAALLGSYLIYRGGVAISLIGIFSLAAGFLYTGGPKPLGYQGLGDLAVFFFFGPIACGGTYFVQALSLDGAVLLAGVAPGLLSMAILVVNNIRDKETDAQTNKGTLAVRFGTSFARKEYLWCIVGATLVPVALVAVKENHYFSLVSMSTLIMALPLINTVFRTDDGPTMNAMLGKTGKLLVIYSVLFSLGWILS
jgi:1,4-dihydroxy-2-naphthoate octaprenyltransferase